jgi:hypothetical protein
MHQVAVGGRGVSVLSQKVRYEDSELLCCHRRLGMRIVSVLLQVVWYKKGPCGGCSACHQVSSWR